MATINKRKRRPILSGIGDAAKALGVDRAHLRQVIWGDRESKALLARVRREFRWLMPRARG